MITCHLRYVIDASKITEFEEYCRLWLKLIPKFGGVHHGYLLPSEGASNIALGSFSFESLAQYEQYRINSPRPGMPDRLQVRQGNQVLPQL